MSEWRYIASRLNGDGTETFLDKELPLSGVSIQNVISGHGGLDATITPEVARLQAEDGLPIFTPWSTAIYAEASGSIRGGGILTSDPISGPNLSLDCIGFSGYLQGQPWMKEDKFDTADPLQVDRYIWETFQKKPFNLGLKPTGDTKSQQRQLSESVSGKKEFYYLAPWQTTDLDKEREQMAAIGGYEWVTKHRWSGEKIIHEIEYGFPKLGRRRTDLRFVAGENISEHIGVQMDGESYASHVLVLGSGQGRKMIQASDDRSSNRLGRWAIVTDKNITKDKIAIDRVAAELEARTGTADITELEVWDHDNAPVGSYSPGDEIYVQSAEGWGNFGALWLRVLGIVHHPEKNTSTLQVRRSEKVT
ncbi:minor tail protein [Brevibacterium phage LuckyBarnes]|uniref:Minor tail protein n=1 Tax=Brevibacterium phage LuckyBarnes TaxID=2027888 RepID=A0A249XQ84_9CAUD|nr:minor tail protein [Brevibacterium phage LuckyBarnes]ASZ73344.1 minor tail protein [Brevibacterium phage LuckyBarnes]